MDNRVKKFADTNNFSEVNNLYWKEIDGFLVSIIEQDTKVFFQIHTELENTSIPNEVSEKLAVISELENVDDCIINRSSILLSFVNERLTEQSTKDLLYELIEMLKGNHIPGLVTCHLCKENLTDGVNSYIKVNNRMMKVHKECYEKFIIDVEHKKIKQKGNCVTGILGAMIFGAVGTIPWIIVSTMGWFASILGMVIALSANYGYNLFKGRQGKVKAVSIFVVLVTMVVAAGFVTQLYELFKYLGNEGIQEKVSVIDGLKLIIILLKEDSTYASSFITNTVLGIGFGLLGSRRIIKEAIANSPIDNLKVELVQ